MRGPRTIPFALAMCIFAAVPAAQAEEPGVEALNRQVGELYHAGRYTEAAAVAAQVLDIARQTLAPRDPNVATSLNNLALVLQTQGDFAAARPLFEEALEIRREALGLRHADVAVSLNHLAGLLQDLGHYRAAQLLCEESLDISREALSPRHPDLATSLNNLALVLQAQGHYAAARPPFEESLDILREALGPRHPDVAVSLGNLAFLLEAQGDYQAAHPALEESLDILREALGPRHPAVATSLNNLAGLLQAQRDYQAARPLYEESLDILREALGPRHPDVAGSLDNLAGLLHAQGDYPAARALYEESLDLWREALGPRHPDVAGSLNNLAGLLQAQGDYPAARALFEESLDVRREALGPRHPNVAVSLGNLASLLEAQGDAAAAQLLHTEALAITEERLSLLDALSEREALAYLDKTRGTLDAWLAAHAAPEHAAPAWTHTLRWKGTLGARQRNARANAELDQGTATARNALAEVRRDLARLAFAKTAPEQRNAHREEMASLSGQAEELERELLSSSADFRRIRAIQEATPADLCAALPPDTALVDILRTTTRDGAGYLAFAMTGDCTVHRVDLGAATPVDDAVAAWRVVLSAPGALDIRVDTRGAAVTERLWTPLAPFLDGASRVLVVPDGPLAALPFAALPLGDGGYLLEEYQVGYLDRANDLLLLETATDARGALVVGGVDFDGAAEGPAPDVRSALAPCVESFDPLPGSVREAEALATRWRRGRRREPLVILGGTEATEAAVSAAFQHKAIAHVATHGFFATSAGCRSVLEGTGGVGYDPMLLSGLALAGANRPADPFAPEDGILTAREVASLDLSGTGLVVLSACETGIGEVRSGQGVLGLRRAFAIAGARSLVMTLWSVGDADAERLMDGFYDRVLRRRSLPAGEALRETQLDVLRESRATTGEGRPGAWAAWVASGR